MKKLTVALIAVFLFPASFALGGEHPALANERPSLVNDDLAFAFHDDVPLQVQFLSKVEMEQTRGQAFPIILAITLALRGYPVMARGVLWAWNNRKKIRMGAVALAGMVKIALDYLGDKEADALREKHDKEINDLKQEHQDLEERVRKLEEKLLEQTDSDNISAYKSVIYNSIVDHLMDEFDSNMAGVPLDGASYDYAYQVAYENSKGYAQEQSNVIVAQIQKDLGLKAFTPNKSTSTSTTAPSKTTSTSGGWLLEEEGEEYDQSVLSQLYMPLSDGHIYSLYGYNFGGTGVQTGSSYGNRSYSYQTFSCTGNSCTLTLHRSPSQGSRSPSVSRQPTNVSLF